MGRPDKLTDAVANQIVEDIREGVPMRWAAVRAGIDETTLHRWMARGAAELQDGTEEERAEQEKFRQFCQRVFLARAELVREAVVVKRRHLLHKNPKISGPASTFVLTQMFSSDFSSKASVELSGPDGKAVSLQHSGRVEVGGEVGLTIPPTSLRDLTVEQIEAFARGLRGDDDTEDEEAPNGSAETSDDER